MSRLRPVDLICYNAGYGFGLLHLVSTFHRCGLVDLFQQVPLSYQKLSPSHVSPGNIRVHEVHGLVFKKFFIKRKGVNKKSQNITGEKEGPKKDHRGIQEMKILKYACLKN